MKNKVFLLVSWEQFGTIVYERYAAAEKNRIRSSQVKLIISNNLLCIVRGATA
jgi:hypothetical protein